MSRYLEPADYVARYGDQEAIRLTFERPTPDTDPPTVVARDDTKIETAIDDAEDVVDGYVARRYALPLASTPRVLKTWVATLTREALHKTRPTPEVTAAADRTRSQLAQVSTGTFRLLDVDEKAAATSGERQAMTSGDARRPTMADTLSDYARLDRGACPEANWRRR